jgi:flagellar assembly factor FliW
VVNPIIFCADYRIEVNPKEIADLKIERLETVETYVVATIPSNPAEISINLQGPILINTENRLGRQLVLVNSKYDVMHRLLDEEAVMAAAEEHELATV